MANMILQNHSALTIQKKKKVISSNFIIHQKKFLQTLSNCFLGILGLKLMRWALRYAHIIRLMPHASCLMHPILITWISPCQYGNMTLVCQYGKMAPLPLSFKYDYHKNFMFSLSYNHLTYLSLIYKDYYELNRCYVKVLKGTSSISSLL